MCIFNDFEYLWRESWQLSIHSGNSIPGQFPTRKPTHLDSPYQENSTLVRLTTKTGDALSRFTWWRVVLLEHYTGGELFRFGFSLGSYFSGESFWWVAVVEICPGEESFDGNWPVESCPGTHFFTLIKLTSKISVLTYFWTFDSYFIKIIIWPII